MRIRKICSSEIIDDKVSHLKEILIISRSLSMFIDKNIKSKPPKTQTTSVEKRMVYMNIDFNGDRITNVLRRRISESLTRMFITATLQIVFFIGSLFISNLKDKLLHLTNSKCVNEFTCLCGARYIGHSTHVLSKRIQKHYLVWP